MSFSWITDLFKSISTFFTTSAGKQAIETLKDMMVIAFPIVQTIAAITGNAGASATVAAVKAAYEKYGIPFLDNIEEGNKQQIGNALQDLAVTVLRKELPPSEANTATNVLKSAVNLAVTAHNTSIKGE